MVSEHIGTTWYITSQFISIMSLNLNEMFGLVTHLFKLRQSRNQNYISEALKIEYNICIFHVHLTSIIGLL